MVKSLSKNLIVGVSTDEFNTKKSKKTIIPYDQRKEIIENIKCVDLVIPEISWEQKVDDIKKYSINAFAMGSDWKGKFDFLRDYCEVIYLPRTENISSTEIKMQIDALLEEHSIEL
tara:strand:+ start:147 stop:494 length:348 start_codon:yes stop_codon:yes gene_type:complete